ncbi:hypothetical protein [Telmatospirillum siberiense]|nr:hypothetical protein [Telmatospirillum siberiense]
MKAVLADSQSTLQSAFAPIERIFQQVGEELSAAVSSLQRITETCGDLSQRMAEEALAASTARLDAAAAQVSKLADSANSGQASLVSLVSLTGGIEERILRLSRTIGEVQILGINAKIEAAHVTARDVDFSVFTREIGRLAELAADGLGKLSVELVSLGRLIDKARADQEDFERENQQSLTAIGHRLEANLQKVMERQQAALAASAGLAAHSERISGRVAKVVADLQIADITRQRVEHVIHGLDVVNGLFESGSVAAQEALDDEHRLPIVATICRLEAAQLQNAEGDFSREIGQIINNLKGLAGDAEMVRQQGAAVCGSAEGTSFLAELGRDLDQAKTLLQRYAEAHAAIEGVTRSVSSGVSEMVKYLAAVHSIEADMRVMGLNATLKCGRLGTEGRALSVIAQELRVFANRTADDGAVIMQGLEKLIAEAESLNRGGQDGESVNISHLIEEMTDSVHSLELANDDLARPMASLERDSHLIGRALDETVARITEHPECVEGLREVVRHLQRMAAVVPQGGFDDLGQIKDRVLALMKGRYTMASEHEIHSLFDQLDGSGSIEIPAAKADKAPSPPTDIDDFLF